jgi:hypothetical protein
MGEASVADEMDQHRTRGVAAEDKKKSELRGPQDAGSTQNPGSLLQNASDSPTKTL